MFYQIGDFHVIPGKEKEFEGLVQQLFIDTRGIATDRIQVYLIRSISDPIHYCISGSWKNVGQWDSVQQTPIRKEFNERVKSLLRGPRMGEMYEVVVAEP